MESTLRIIFELKTKKTCFLCCRRQNLGLKYYALPVLLDFCLSVIPGVRDTTHFALLLIEKYDKECNKDANAFSQLCLATFPASEQDSILNIFSTENKTGGVPICWKDCILASQAQKFLSTAIDTPSIVIDDVPFDIGYMTYDPARYEEFLTEKQHRLVHKLFAASIIPSQESIHIEVNTSPSKFFRMRCRFSIQHHSDDTMDYLMWEDDGTPKHVVRTFPIASEYINIAMPRLKETLQQHASLCHALSSVHFIVTLTGNMIITLLYDDVIGPDWENSARIARTELFQACSPHITSIQFVGRGLLKSKVVLDVDSIEESFVLADGRRIEYLQVLDGFSNPNATVNIKSLNFMCSIIQNIPGLGSCAGAGDRIDLLEMYCGMGNHTCALAQYARRVVAVELNKHLCRAAKLNLERNSITNAYVITGDSHDFAERVLKKKRFTSKTGEVYTFGAVVVDPPRCGLDASTLAMITDYAHIIYISCNPDALVRDLRMLCETHVINRFAVFDHFPYTPHLESGVYLVKKES